VGSDSIRPKDSLTLTFMAGPREWLSKKRRPSLRPPGTADDPPYTATATLWKVEVTASNV
jgi:hypothetical protein